MTDRYERIRAALADLARVRELAEKWRAAPQDPEEPLLAMATDELEAIQNESLPLMARRSRHKDDDLGELYENGKRLCTISGEPPLREPMPGFVLYRIADTDEHGLPVIERTKDMPERAKYRITYITRKRVYYTSIPQLALEAHRSGAVSERIEDYRPAAQENER